MSKWSVEKRKKNFVVQYDKEEWIVQSLHSISPGQALDAVIYGCCGRQMKSHGYYSYGVPLEHAERFCGVAKVIRTKGLPGDVIPTDVA